jgi:methylenetetrahydrofolate reductase (NADPH)
MYVLETIAERRRGKEILPSVEITPNHVDKKTYQKLDYLVDLGIPYINITSHRLNPSAPEDSDVDMPDIAYQLTERYSHLSYERKPSIVPHIVCGGNSKRDVNYTLGMLRKIGIRDAVGLRGDGIKKDGVSHPYAPENDGFSYASELISHMSDYSLGVGWDLSIGAACYPEGHCENRVGDYRKNQEAEIDAMWRKADAGADYFVSQMFTDNETFFDLKDRAADAGMRQPIVAGIKPLTTIEHLTSIPNTFSVTVSKKLRDRMMEERSDSEKVKAAGLGFCIKQIEELYDDSVPVHIYMTKYTPIRTLADLLVKRLGIRTPARCAV